MRLKSAKYLLIFIVVLGCFSEPDVSIQIENKVEEDGNFKYLYDKALSSVDKGDRDNGIELLEKALSVAKDNIDSSNAAFELFDCLMDVGRFNEASGYMKYMYLGIREEPEFDFWNGYNQTCFYLRIEDLEKVISFGNKTKKIASHLEIDYDVEHSLNTFIALALIDLNNYEELAFLIESYDSTALNKKLLFEGDFISATEILSRIK
jgi:tetratricopeptide (TPR) repeat protein